MAPLGYRLPEGEDLKKDEGVYEDLGFPGAVGSADCTHIAWERCPFSETTLHKGKEGYTSIVFEVICDHAGRIIASTRGFPGAQNDKTVVNRDLSVMRIRDVEPWASYKYELCDEKGDTTEHTGGWLLVDGGYHKVSTHLPCEMLIWAGAVLRCDNFDTEFESIRPPRHP